MTETGEALERKIEVQNRERVAQESGERAELLELAAGVLRRIADDPHRYIDIISLKEKIAAEMGIEPGEIDERLKRANDEVANAGKREQGIAESAASMAESIDSSAPPPPGPPPADLGHPETGGGLGILTK